MSSIPHTLCPGDSPYSKRHFNCSELATGHDLWGPLWPFIVNYSLWVMLIKFSKKPHFHDFIFCCVSFKIANKRRVLYYAVLPPFSSSLSVQGKPFPFLPLQHIPSRPPTPKHLPPTNCKKPNVVTASKFGALYATVYDIHKTGKELQ